MFNSEAAHPQPWQQMNTAVNGYTDFSISPHG